MSRRPGLGKGFFEKYKSDFNEFDVVGIPGHGVRHKIPRFYTDQLPEEIQEEIKLLRKTFKDSHPEEFTPARMRAKEIVKTQRVKQMRRSL
jgi:hypothetical protein